MSISTKRIVLTNFLLMTPGKILTLEDNNPEGAAGQAWMPNTPVASFRAPSFTIRSAPAPPSSAGWKSSTTVPGMSASRFFNSLAAACVGTGVIC